ncbi:MAG: MFS transporter [Bryobacteraceae bacterium]|jgi:ACS family hexuronate transporter-like MFS transporter
MQPRVETVPAEIAPLQFRKRWWVVWALFGSTVINYINRQTLSVLAPVITRDLHLSHSALSRIFGAFQISYAFTWLLGGILIDLIGTRAGLSLAVIWWSAVSAVTGFVSSAASFTGLRFLLGIGEGFNWPGASKAVAECFPASERSVAVAIFDSGSSIGAVLAAMSMPAIALHFGWRMAFVFSGLLGIGWLAWWLAVCPRRATVPSPSRQSSAQYFRNWFPLLKKSDTWAIVLARSFSDPVWWFYVFWLPQYLSDARGFSLKQIALFAWIPFIAADLGNFGGGFAAKILIARGVSVIRARKLVCLISSAPMLLAIPAAQARTPFEALAFICVVLFGYASFSTMGLTLPSDLFPSEVVASVTGLSGLGAGLVGTAFTLAVGLLVDRFSYTPAFVLAAALPLLGTAAVLWLIKDGRDARPE